MKKTFAFAVVLLAFAGMQSAFAAVSPSVFFGDYVLTKIVYINCEQDLSITGFNGDVNLGSYFFASMNEGVQAYDDSSTHTDALSYTTDANELIQKVTTYNKLDHTTSSYRTRVTLSGKVLRIRNDDSQFPNLPIECVYKKVDTAP